MYTVGGGSVSTPALTRGLREIGEQAKKQLDETGSLAGFEAKVTDDSTGQGSVTITVSARAMAAYDASAAKDDTFLAFTLRQTQADGTPDGGGGGSSLVIHSDQDIDAFVTTLEGVAKEQTFASFLYGTPEEIAAVYPEVGATAAAPGSAAPAAPGGTASSDAQKQVFDKLQEKQTQSNQLIDLLQSFLDGRNGSKRDSARSDDATQSGKSEESAIRTRLAQFTGTDITT